MNTRLILSSREQPQLDGWGNPLMYWSDGESYRFVSPGKGGGKDRAWLGTVEAGPTGSFAADIVFVDGQFVAWPEGQQR